MVVPRSDATLNILLKGPLANAPYVASGRIVNALSKWGYVVEHDKDMYVPPGGFRHELIQDATSLRAVVVGSRVAFYRLRTPITESEARGILDLFEQHGLQAQRYAHQDGNGNKIRTNGTLTVSGYFGSFPKT